MFSERLAAFGSSVEESSYNVDEVHRRDTLVHVERLPERLGSAEVINE